MDGYRILAWLPASEGMSVHNYKIFKLLEQSKKYDVIVKDKSEFGLRAEYRSQEDFDKIYRLYQPNVILLHMVNMNCLPIDIPKNIYVITYLDHPIEPFTIFGEKYFKNINKRNYFLVSLLNLERIDREHILNNGQYKNKIICIPFVAFLDELAQPCENEERFRCDVSLVTSRKDLAYYKWQLSLDEKTAVGRSLMHCVALVASEVRKEILLRESAVTDMDWIEKILKQYFDLLGIWNLARNKEMLLECWKLIVYNVVMYVEFGNCVADWILEEDYDLKIWGGGWEKESKYRNKAMGVLPECSAELAYARQYSKISVENNLYQGVHRRTFENIYYGSLNMMIYPGEGLQYTDYKQFFVDKESIVVYRNKKELLSNLDYYLSHEEERKQVIRAGQDIIKEKKLDAFHVMEGFWGEFLRRIEDENG